MGGLCAYCGAARHSRKIMNTNVLLLLQFANGFVAFLNAGLAAALPKGPYTLLIALSVGALNAGLGTLLQNIGNKTSPK